MEPDKEVYYKDRLNEIDRLKLYEIEVDDLLDNYAREVALELNIEIGLVSVVLDEAQKFAGHYGLTGWLKEIKGTPIEWSYCVNSIKTQMPFIVQDAREHPKTKDNPLTEGEGIRCYAGVPLITKKNQVIGNLCVIGTSDSREFLDSDIQLLKKYATKVMDHLEKRIENS